jgi:hypothetical protein
MAPEQSRITLSSMPGTLAASARRIMLERIDRVDIHPVGEVDYAAGRNSFGERAFHHPERNTGDPVEGVDKELLNTQGRVMDRTLGRQQAEFESSVHFEILYMQPGGGAG